MPRLPQPGQDSGTWGEILNQYLLQSHTQSGALKDGIVGANNIANGAIGEANLDPSIVDKLNTISGGITIADGSITTAKLADGSVTSAKLANGSITEADLSPAVVAKLNPTNTLPAGSSLINTQTNTGTWSLSLSSVNNAHTDGYKILWYTQGSGAAPTSANGLAAGDAINGVLV